jgi:hypothetical protein
MNKKQLIYENKIRLDSYITNLILFCCNNGIEFLPNDGELENVIFKSTNKTLKISYNIFWNMQNYKVLW